MKNSVNDFNSDSIVQDVMHVMQGFMDKGYKAIYIPEKGEEVESIGAESLMEFMERCGVTGAVPIMNYDMVLGEDKPIMNDIYRLSDGKGGVIAILA